MSRLQLNSSLVLSTFLLSSCSHETPVTQWSGTVDSTGDTITVLTTTSPTAEWPPVEIVDSVRVLWSNEALDRPSAIATEGDHLYVADRTQIHVLGGPGYSEVSTIGRQGRGPGEFRSIDGLAVTNGDTLLVWDGAQRRLTWMLRSGRIVRTRSVIPPPRYQGARRALLRTGPEGLILAWSSGLVQPMAPPDSVVLTLMRWNDDTARVLATIPDIAWVDGGMMLGPRYPFGQRPVFTVGDSGLYAYSDGVTYCVTVKRLGGGGVRQICRRWDRQLVDGANAAPADTAGIGTFGRPFAAIVAKQEFGREKNSLDDIRLDAAGQLWVRVVDSSLRYHPMYIDRLPQLRPAHYLWEVFDTGGKLARRVALPGRFKPLAVSPQHILGLLEDVDGTLSVARVDMLVH